jgi:hypothetical protein
MLLSIDRIVQDDCSTSDGDSKSSSFNYGVSQLLNQAAAVVYLLNAPKVIVLTVFFLTSTRTMVLMYSTVVRC